MITPKLGSQPVNQRKNKMFSCGTCRTTTMLLLFSGPVMSDSLQPHGLQHARPPCPSSTLRVYSNSCSLSLWCHPTVSSCHPLLFLPSIFQHQDLFQWVHSSHQVARVLELQLKLILFMIDWCDLLVVQGTLRSLFQNHNSKASILQLSAFFVVLTNLYMP